MKTIGKVLLFMVAIISLSSCASLPTRGGFGWAYTDISECQTVHDANPCGSKVGKAKLKNILGLVVLGDASVETAAKSAGITKISHIDSKKKSILGIYSTYEIYVYGE